mgnify:CR=1 FL=1
MVIAMNDVFSKSEDVVSRRIAEEYIIVPIHKKADDVDCIYTINNVAGFIWELIDGKKRVNEICDVLTEEFDVSAGDAEADLTELLGQLKDIGAIKGQ